jgi:2',3'-cyclic-nucleotide 2'-phosphodiesterase (5'-nucleotidase family)
LGLPENAGACLVAALALLTAAGCHRNSPPGAGAVSTADAAIALVDAAPPPPPPRGRDLALVYSSNIQGHATPCDCVRPLGGLARRATVIARARSEADGVLVVDAGDLFDVGRRAQLMASAVTSSGLDAFTPGEADLALGVAQLQRMAAARQLPVISSNLTDTAGKRLFGAEKVVSVAGVPIGVFGVSEPPTPQDAARWQAAGIRVQPAAAAAQEAIAALRRAGARVVVGLFHVGSPAATRRLVAGLSGLDWAVLGHSALNLDTPEQAGTARLLEAFAEGKYLGRLDLHVVGDSFAFADAGQRAELEAILADHRRQLGDYDRSLGGMDPAALEAYYQQRRAQLQAAIARETEALARLPRAITGSWFENRVIPLDPTIPDESIVKGTLEGFLRPPATTPPGRAQRR